MTCASSRGTGLSMKLTNPAWVIRPAMPMCSYIALSVRDETLSAQMMKILADLDRNGNAMKRACQLPSRLEMFVQLVGSFESAICKKFSGKVGLSRSAVCL